VLVIPATQEVEAGGLGVPGQPRRPCLKNKMKTKGLERWLPSSRAFANARPWVQALVFWGKNCFFFRDLSKPPFLKFPHTFSII
jgi:hypothetical protein